MHDWQSEVRARLAPLNLKPEREADIVDEIAQHLAERYREATQAGAAPDEATRVALAEFRAGNVLAQRIAALRQAHAPTTVTAGASTERLFADLKQDLRYALRAFAKQRGFAATAVLTLALGIGATTAIFSVVNAIVIKPLPYPESDAIVTVMHSSQTGNARNDFPFTPQMLEIYSANGQAFEELGMYRSGEVTITGLRDPEQANTLVVTESTLRVLNVQPVLGRWFSRDDDRPGAVETTILSNGYWERRFGSDPGVIGSTITLDGTPHEVIGVMPARFMLREISFDLILPMRLNMAQPRPDFCCVGVARLKPGITVAAANADVGHMLPVYVDRYMRPNFGGADALQLRAAVRPLKEDVVGSVGEVLWALLGSISLLLLIACANVANLLLIRAETRATELALRTALGAGSGRLARGLMVESLTLSLVGGVIGVALAYGGLRVLLAFPPTNLPRLNEIAIDLPVLGFAFGVSVLSGLFFGLVPILRIAGPRLGNLAGALRGGGRWASAGKNQYRSQNALVVIQVALALVLLVSSGLMIRSFQNLRSVEPGFSDPAAVQTVRISLPGSMDSDSVARTHEQILERLAAIPGVTSAAYTTALPMEGVGAGNFMVAVEGEIYQSGQLPPTRRIVALSPGLLRTLGTPLLAGRDFEWTEVHEQRNVALVSEGFARETWNSIEGALEKRLDVGADGSWLEVIGVVADVYHNGVDQEAPPTLYWPARQQQFMTGLGTVVPYWVAFALRSERTGTESMLADIRRAVSEVTPDLPIAEVGTLAQIYRDHPSMARSSFSLALLGIAGAMALLLSIVGIYGVLAYAVMQRQREVGIRVALGAAPRAVKRMFVYRGMILSAIGIVLGAAAAAALTRLMSSLLFGVTPLDVATFVAAAAFLAMAALFASYIPARRATTIDPMETLRAE
jgi:putative ABC transport system permease protein